MAITSHSGEGLPAARHGAGNRSLDSPLNVPEVCAFLRTSNHWLSGGLVIIEIGILGQGDRRRRRSAWLSRRHKRLRHSDALELLLAVYDQVVQIQLAPP